MVDSDWVKRAKQGDVDAIALLINQSLQTEGVTAKAQRSDDALQILLESAVPLDQAAVLPRIHQGMERLAISNVRQVSVYSKRTDSEFPDWSAQVALSEPMPESTPEAAIFAATPPPVPPLSESSSSQLPFSQPVEKSATLTRGEEQLFALFAHLGPLLGYLLWLGNDALFVVWGTGSVWLIGRIGVPLLIFLTKGQSSEFVKAQSKEALNFQISMLLYWIGVAVLFVVLIGFLMILPLAIFEVICMIMAAVKAGDRQLFRYPLNLRLIK